MTEKRNTLRRYLVLRIKLLEFLDLAAIRKAISSDRLAVENPVGRISSDFADSLRTMQLSYLALFVDKSRDGMNAIKLWKEVFPEHLQVIDLTWKEIEPAWELIRQFRNKAGFHADKPEYFFEARSAVVLKSELIASALQSFQSLLRDIFVWEAAITPALSSTLDELLDHLEKKPGVKFNRSEFRRYLMLP